MTHLIPTRDRAQATRYAFAQVVGILARLPDSPEVGVEPTDDLDKWIVRTTDPDNEDTPTSSGPWYVREVAE